jgi:Pyruvate/2-oxoacid:ferredoxin oxidoreductase delta subunit
LTRDIAEISKILIMNERPTDAKIRNLLEERILCKFCVKHGAGKKWYENVHNYSKELYEEINAHQWTVDHWRVNDKTYADGVTGLYDLVKDPVKGAPIRKTWNDILHKDTPPQKWPEGHMCQVVTLEEAKQMVKIAGPVVKFQCICRKFIRNTTEKVCIAFLKHAEVAEMFPDHVYKGVDRMSPEEAGSFLEEANERGFVHTASAVPMPYVGAVCNCHYPECGILRPKLDLGIDSCLKGHYVASVNVDKCTGCKTCLARCQFGAMHFSEILGRAQVYQFRCFGCGHCATTCPEHAIDMVAKEKIPTLKDVW